MPAPMTTRLGGAALAALCALAGAAAAAEDAAAAAEQPGGELRLVATERRASAHGPLAAAEAVQRGTAPPPPSTLLAEAEARHTLRTKVGATPWSLTANVLLRHERREGVGDGDARINELHVSADLGAWQASAGKKVVGWDVGYGFRPNDFVQQEARRTLLASTPAGRPLLQLERFDADTAWSLVWVNPQRWNDTAAGSRGADESAFALRVYRRFGALDAYGFARHGAHTRTSLGAAFAWVATDELELHASARVLQRHDGWRLASDTAAGALVAANPWQIATRGGTAVWLVGANWTGSARQSVLVEVWHDGTAPADAEWERWRARNAALVRLPSPPVPAAAKAGNLAWQASPFAAPSLRRDNVFVRFAWQPEPWQLTLDALVTPADGGRIVTAGVQWQGDRWRFDAAWRRFGGPRGAVLAQLPTRSSVLLAATRAF